MASPRSRQPQSWETLVGQQNIRYGRGAFSEKRTDAQTTLTEKKVKELLTILGCVFSWAIYVIGLIAPLTPSEGIPSVVELIVFVGIPLVILGLCWLKSSTLWAKILMIIQGAVVIGFTYWLLLLEM